MALIRPRLTDHYDISFTQEEADFAIPFLDEDLPFVSLELVARSWKLVIILTSRGQKTTPCHLFSRYGQSILDSPGGLHLTLPLNSGSDLHVSILSPSENCSSLKGKAG
jgi:hypothetical protein